MFPKVFQIPFLNIPINSYGVMIMIGFLIATFIGDKRLKKSGINPDFGFDLAIIGMLFGLLGGKIMYVLQNAHEFTRSLRIFDITDGGMHPAGALLGLIPYIIYWSTTRNKPIKTFSREFFIVIFSTLIVSILGVRIIHLIVNRHDYDWRMLSTWQSGFVLYGGFALGIISGIIYTLLRGQNLLKVADIAAPSMMIGLAFGRLGCFLNGCCFGKICELPWAVSFPRGSNGYETPPFQLQRERGDIAFEAQETLPIHPTQLYESLACIAIYFVLSFFLKKKKKDGFVFLSLGVLYPIFRFFNEFLRDDPGREVFGIYPLTFSQTAGIVVILVSLIGLVLLSRKPVSKAE